MTEKPQTTIIVYPANDNDDAPAWFTALAMFLGGVGFAYLGVQWLL